MTHVVAPPPPFTAERLERLLEIEGSHFWFAGRRALVEHVVGRFSESGARVLDIGVGGGLQAERLSDRGYSLTVLDFLPEGLCRLNRLGRGIACVQSTAESLAFAEGTFDLVLALDVLEHTDDTVAIQEIVRVLRPGGMLVVTVPAYNWLWGVRDERAGHRRRYTCRRLKSALQTARLQVSRTGYYQSLLFPIVLLSRVLGRRDERMRDLEDVPPALVNRVLRTVTLFEVWLGRVVRWPIGSSAFAVAIKPVTADA